MAQTLASATATVDVAVVGAGIAGASLAYFAAPHARVLLLERETQPGMHSTGRSAAMFMESYGSPQVRALTRASRPFLEQPPAGFCSTPLLSPRGARYIASVAQRGELQALYSNLLQDGCPAQWLEGAAARLLVPVLMPEACDSAVLDPAAADLDVHALHQSFLRGARSKGAQLRCSAEVLSLQRVGARSGVDGADSGAAHWLLHTRSGPVHARWVVNAAGAWADELAARAGVAGIGLEPRRRSAFVFDGLVDADAAARAQMADMALWPCVASVDETFYFKPEAGLLLGSPANAEPVPPHDVMPEELDIATGIARIEAATSLRIRRPRRSWAGLRSFVPDGNLVAGFDTAPGTAFDPAVPGFFWLAAQGGYGIQTSAAMGACAAALLLGLPQPAWAAAALPVLHTLAPRRG